MRTFAGGIYYDDGLASNVSPGAPKLETSVASCKFQMHPKIDNLNMDMIVISLSPDVIQVGASLFQVTMTDGNKTHD